MTNSAELDQYIAECVAAAPPLSDGQMARLGAILAPVVARAAERARGGTTT